MYGLDEEMLRGEFDDEGKGEVVSAVREACRLSFSLKDSGDLIAMVTIGDHYGMCLDCLTKYLARVVVVDSFEKVMYAGIVGKATQHSGRGVGDRRADARCKGQPPNSGQIRAGRPGEIESIRFGLGSRLLMRQDPARACRPYFKATEQSDGRVRYTGLVDKSHAVAVIRRCAVLHDDRIGQPASKETSGRFVATRPILLDRYIDLHHILRMPGRKVGPINVRQHVVWGRRDISQGKSWGIAKSGEGFESGHPEMMPEATRLRHAWQDPRVNVICDLDGVIWLADDAISGSAQAVADLREAGHRVTFVSNNSFAPVSTVEAKLERFGIPATGDVFTSAQAAASLIESGERVLLLGGPGAAECLCDAGAQLVEEGPADVVVVGFHRTFDYEALRKAATALRAGARFVATNDDATYPTPNGPIPGCGSLVAAVQTGSGKAPVIAGKPYAPMAAVVRRALGDSGDFIVIGDRADTDGEFAVRLGARFALVLSGVVRPSDLPVTPSPDLIADDLFQMAKLLLSGT